MSRGGRRHISDALRRVLSSYSYKVFPVLCSPVWTLNGNPRVHQNLSTSGSATPYRVWVHAYLDNWIFREHSPEQSLQHTRQTIQLLQSLRWTIIWKKSMFDPPRILDFLGLHFNLERAIISPPDSFLDAFTSVPSIKFHSHACTQVIGH